MKIRDVMESAGTTERQIRYLIAEGFMPPPRGGRSNAEYGEDHVEAIRRYTRLRDLGFPPAAIKLMLEAREGVPFPVAVGVTLTIDPGLIGSGSDPGPIVAAIHNLLNDIMKGTTHDTRRTSSDS